MLSFYSFSETGIIGHWFHYDGDNNCLLNHNIAAMDKTGLGPCSLECSTNVQCLSFNIKKTNEETTCTLTNTVRDLQPTSDYVTAQGCQHFYTV